MEDKISFEGLVSGKKFDKEGSLLTEYNKKTKELIDIEDIEKDKICIDANMMTNAILDAEFKKILIQNIGEDFAYTTEVCKKETIGNVKSEMNINWQEAEKKFEEFKKEISLKFLDFKEEYEQEGVKLFTNILSSGTKIKNKNTFLKDCINIVILLKNNVSVFFCNDEELAKVCKKFKIKFVTIPASSDKTIKDFWRSQTKSKYRKKG